MTGLSTLNDECRNAWLCAARHQYGFREEPDDCVLSYAEQLAEHDANASWCEERRRHDYREGRHDYALSYAARTADGMTVAECTAVAAHNFVAAGCTVVDAESAAAALRDELREDVEWCGFDSAVATSYGALDESVLSCVAPHEDGSRVERSPYALSCEAHDQCASVGENVVRRPTALRRMQLPESANQISG